LELKPMLGEFTKKEAALNSMAPVEVDVMPPAADIPRGPMKSSVPCMAERL
jgi:hypothetical protein